MKKRLFSVLLVVVLAASLCVGAFAFDYMNPPEPGAADGWVEVRSQWDSDNMLAGHRVTESAYTFDSEGRILTRQDTFTDAENPDENDQSTWLYSYDELGRLSRTVRSDGNHEMVYLYNDDGTHFLKYTWWYSEANKDNPTVTYRTYDPAADWYWFGKWTFAFDDQGNVTRRTNEDGVDIVYSNEFDEQGRLSKVTMVSQSDQTEQTQTYTYDADGGYVLVWASKTGGEEFTYNADGLLIQYRNTYYEDAPAVIYEYDDHGNNTRIYYSETTQRNISYEQIPENEDPEPIAPPEPTDPPEPIAPPEPVNPFKDVPSGEYYTDAVLWAVNHDPQITNGTGEDTFSPDQTCTRAQVVTFLWRAAGEPAPNIDKNPFTDVKETDYFYKAVLWAVEKGITKGTSDTTFSPAQGCTRGQVVTFLWRAAGEPAPANRANPFQDVPSGAYYTDAVLWAVNHDPQITNGTDKDAFSPDATCTRGQIVTFLYRDLAE